MTTCQACRRVVPLIEVKWLYFVKDGEVVGVRACRECDRRFIEERRLREKHMRLMESIIGIEPKEHSWNVLNILGVRESH